MMHFYAMTFNARSSYIAVAYIEVLAYIKVDVKVEEYGRIFNNFT